METILVISFSYLDKDARVTRQIQTLKKKYHVIAAGYSAPNSDEVDFFHIEDLARSFFTKVRAIFFLIFKRYERVYWDSKCRILKRRLKSYLKDHHIDAVVVNDPSPLPLITSLVQDHIKIILDLHEYSPRQHEHSLTWRLFIQNYVMYQCQTYFKKVDCFMTVCQSIADEYKRVFSLENVGVVMNAPAYSLDCQIVVPTENRIRMIHHGAAMRQRKLEKMIDVMNLLDERFSLDFMLIPSYDPGYLEWLKEYAKDNKAVNFIEPCAVDEITSKINHYDIGIFILDNITNFSYTYSLPNKFFEFIQARLGIVVGPSPEMKSFVDRYNLGIVSDSFDSLSVVNALLKLDSEKIISFKNNSDAVAKQLCAEVEQEKFLNLVNTCIN